MRTTEPRGGRIMFSPLRSHSNRMANYKITISVWLVLLTTARLPAQELTIWLNTNDCINCTSALGQIHELDTTVFVNIICAVGQERFIPTLLDGFNLQPGGRIQLLYVPSKKLQKQAPTASICNYSVHQSMLMKFPLRDLGTKVNSINRLSHSYTSSVKLPLAQALPVTDRLQAVVYQNQLVIADYVTAKTYLIGLNEKDSAMVKELILPDRWKREYLWKIGKDTVRYDSTVATLKAQNAFLPKVGCMNVAGDTLQLLANIIYLDLDSDGDIFNMYPAFVRMVGDQIVDTWQCDWLLPPPLLDVYIMLTQDGFYIDDDQITMPLYKVGSVSETDSIHLFGKFNRSGYSIKYIGTPSPTLPNQFLTQGPDNHFPVCGVHGATYRMISYPFFADLSTDRSFDLSKTLIKNPNAKFFDGDVPYYWSQDAMLIDRNTLMVLYQWKGTMNVSWVDLVSNRLIRQVKLDVDDIVNSTLHFMDDGGVVGLDQKYNVVHIFR